MTDLRDLIFDFFLCNHVLDTSNVKIHTEVKVGRKDVVFEA